MPVMSDGLKSLKATLSKLDQALPASVLSSQWLGSREAKSDRRQEACLIARLGDLVRSLRQLMTIAIEVSEGLSERGDRLPDVSGEVIDRLKFLIETAYIYSKPLLETMAEITSVLVLGEEGVCKFAHIRGKLEPADKSYDLLCRLDRLQEHVDLFRNKMLIHRKPYVDAAPYMQATNASGVVDMKLLGMSTETEAKLLEDFHLLCQKLRSLGASDAESSRLSIVADLIERETTSYAKASVLARFISWIPHNLKDLKELSRGLLGKSGFESEFLSSILEAIVTAFSDFMSSFNERLKLIYQPVDFSQLEKELLMELEQSEKGNGKRLKRQD